MNVALAPEGQMTDFAAIAGILVAFLSMIFTLRSSLSGQEDLNFYKATEYLGSNSITLRIAGAQILQRLHTKARFRAAVDFIYLDHLHQRGKMCITEKANASPELPLAAEVLFRAGFFNRWFRSKCYARHVATCVTFSQRLRQLALSATRRLLEIWVRIQSLTHRIPARLFVFPVDEEPSQLDLRQSSWRGLTLPHSWRMQVFPPSDLAEADFSCTTIQDLDLSECKGDSALFCNAKAMRSFLPKSLRNANFSGAVFDQCDFVNRNLVGATLTGTFKCCDFSGADLSEANLGGTFLRCKFYGTILTNANAAGARFEAADVDDKTNFEGVQWTTALIVDFKGLSPAQLQEIQLLADEDKQHQQDFVNFDFIPPTSKTSP